MTKEELGRRIYNASHLTGQFTLRSGAVSQEYFDKYQFESNPKLLREIAEQLAKDIPPQTEILAGLEMGGIPIATALSLYTELPQVLVRKTAKGYGTEKLAEGVDISGRNVTLVEDVITTGGQVVRSAGELRNMDANVEYALCVIERDEIGRRNLERDGIELYSLFTSDELKHLGSRDK